MPSTKSFFHKNRSQASLLSIHDSNDKRSLRSIQASPIDSPLHSPRFPSSSAVSSEGKDDEDGYSSGQPSVYRPDEGRSYHANNLLTRSQSQRSPPGYPTSHQPTINLVGSAAGSADHTIEGNPDSYYLQALPAAPPKEDSKRRRFFKLGSSSTTKEQPYTPPPPARLGRSISVKRKDPQAAADIEYYHRQSQQIQQRWPSQSGPGNLAPQPTNVGEVDEDEIIPTHVRESSHEVRPPIPAKDPLRSPQFRPTSPQEPLYGKPSLQGVVTNIPQRHPFERQGSATSSVWESTARSFHEQQRAHSETFQRNTAYQSSLSGAPNQVPSSYHSSPASATSTSSHPLPARGPQDLRQQYQQELYRDRPSSQQSSYEPPSPLQSVSRAYDIHHERQGSNRSSLNAYSTTNSMGPPPPPQQQAQGRSSNELAQQNQGSGLLREGQAYQPYSQGAQGQNQASNASNQYDARLNINQQNQQFRPTPQPSPLPPQATSEQGRSTPPPSRSRDDLSNLDVAQLVTRHDELQEKYRKVKKYYFDKDAQVQQLQNTLAHLRLLQSRTSLDDNEYMNRFSRLDGAINNLAFNLRRDWRSVPPWLAQHVNKDAATSPTKEMTAVGRACISRWLVDELFERYFHPGLEPGLSAQLKIIEKYLRQHAPPTPSEEEREALMSRISNWRLATLDGLQESLTSPAATENREQLTDTLVEKLVASLSMLLKEPAPPGLDGGVSMIIELAIGISANLPLESRDVFINYILPGSRIDEGYMKIESGLPALTNPGESISEEGQGDDAASVEAKDGNEMEERPSNNSTHPQQERKELVREREPPLQAAKKKGMFGGFMGGNKKGGTAPVGNGPVQQQQQQQPPPPKEERVRFSAFMAVENRGRSVLVKAPVYIVELNK